MIGLIPFIEGFSTTDLSVSADYKDISAGDCNIHRTNEVSLKNRSLKSVLFHNVDKHNVIMNDTIPSPNIVTNDTKHRKKKSKKTKSNKDDNHYEKTEQDNNVEPCAKLPKHAKENKSALCLVYIEHKKSTTPQNVSEQTQLHHTKERKHRISEVKTAATGPKAIQETGQQARISVYQDGCTEICTNTTNGKEYKHRQKCEIEHPNIDQSVSTKPIHAPEHRKHKKRPGHETNRENEVRLETEVNVMRSQKSTKQHAHHHQQNVDLVAILHRNVPKDNNCIENTEMDLQYPSSTLVQLKKHRHKEPVIPEEMDVAFIRNHRRKSSKQHAIDDLHEHETEIRSFFYQDIPEQDKLTYIPKTSAIDRLFDVPNKPEKKKNSTMKHRDYYNDSDVHESPGLREHLNKIVAKDKIEDRPHSVKKKLAHSSKTPNKLTLLELKESLENQEKTLFTKATYDEKPLLHDARQNGQQEKIRKTPKDKKTGSRRATAVGEDKKHKEKEQNCDIVIDQKKCKENHQNFGNEVKLPNKSTRTKASTETSKIPVPSGKHSVSSNCPTTKLNPIQPKPHRQHSKNPTSHQKHKNATCPSNAPCVPGVLQPSCNDDRKVSVTNPLIVTKNQPDLASKLYLENAANEIKEEVPRRDGPRINVIIKSTAVRNSNHYEQAAVYKSAIRNEQKIVISANGIVNEQNKAAFIQKKNDGHAIQYTHELTSKETLCTQPQSSFETNPVGNIQGQSYPFQVNNATRQDTIFRSSLMLHNAMPVQNQVGHANVPLFHMQYGTKAPGAPNINDLKTLTTKTFKAILPVGRTSQTHVRCAPNIIYPTIFWPATVVEELENEPDIEEHQDVCKIRSARCNETQTDGWNSLPQKSMQSNTNIPYVPHQSANRIDASTPIRKREYIHVHAKPNKRQKLTETNCAAVQLFTTRSEKFDIPSTYSSGLDMQIGSTDNIGQVHPLSNTSIHRKVTDWQQGSSKYLSQAHYAQCHGVSTDVLLDCPRASFVSTSPLRKKSTFSGIPRPIKSKIENKETTVAKSDTVPGMLNNECPRVFEKVGTPRNGSEIKIPIIPSVNGIRSQLTRSTKCTLQNESNISPNLIYDSPNDRKNGLLTSNFKIEQDNFSVYGRTPAHVKPLNAPFIFKMEHSKGNLVRQESKRHTASNCSNKIGSLGTDSIILPNSIWTMSKPPDGNMVTTSQTRIPLATPVQPSQATENMDDQESDGADRIRVLKNLIHTMSDDTTHMSPKPCPVSSTILPMPVIESGHTSDESYHEKKTSVQTVKKRNSNHSVRSISSGCNMNEAVPSNTKNPLGRKLVPRSEVNVISARKKSATMNQSNPDTCIALPQMNSTRFIPTTSTQGAKSRERIRNNMSKAIINYENIDFSLKYNCNKQPNASPQMRKKVEQPTLKPKVAAKNNKLNVSIVPEVEQEIRFVNYDSEYDTAVTPSVCGESNEPCTLNTRKKSTTLRTRKAIGRTKSEMQSMKAFYHRYRGCVFGNTNFTVYHTSNAHNHSSSRDRKRSSNSSPSTNDAPSISSNTTNSDPKPSTMPALAAIVSGSLTDIASAVQDSFESSTKDTNASTRNSHRKTLDAAQIVKPEKHTKKKKLDERNEKQKVDNDEVHDSKISKHKSDKHTTKNTHNDTECFSDCIKFTVDSIRTVTSERRKKTVESRAPVNVSDEDCMKTCPKINEPKPHRHKVVDPPVPEKVIEEVPQKHRRGSVKSRESVKEKEIAQMDDESSKTESSIEEAPQKRRRSSVKSRESVKEKEMPAQMDDVSSKAESSIAEAPQKHRRSSVKSRDSVKEKEISAQMDDVSSKAESSIASDVAGSQSVLSIDIVNNRQSSSDRSKISTNTGRKPSAITETDEIISELNIDTKHKHHTPRAQRSGRQSVDEGKAVKDSSFTSEKHKHDSSLRRRSEERSSTDQHSAKHHKTKRETSDHESNKHSTSTSLVTEDQYHDDHRKRSKSTASEDLDEYPTDNSARRKETVSKLSQDLSIDQDRNKSAGSTAQRKEIVSLLSEDISEDQNENQSTENTAQKKDTVSTLGKNSSLNQNKSKSVDIAVQEKETGSTLNKNSGLNQNKSKSTDFAVEERDTVSILNKNSSLNQNKSKSNDIAVQEKETGSTLNKNSSLNQNKSKSTDFAVEEKETGNTLNKNSSLNQNKSKSTDFAVEEKATGSTLNKNSSLNQNKSKSKDFAVEEKETGSTLNKNSSLNQNKSKSKDFAVEEKETGSTLNKNSSLNQNKSKSTDFAVEEKETASTLNKNSSFDQNQHKSMTSKPKSSTVLEVPVKDSVMANTENVSFVIDPATLGNDDSILSDPEDLGKPSAGGSDAAGSETAVSVMSPVQNLNTSHEFSEIHKRNVRISGINEEDENEKDQSINWSPLEHSNEDKMCKTNAFIVEKFVKTPFNDVTRALTMDIPHSWRERFANNVTEFSTVKEDLKKLDETSDDTASSKEDPHTPIKETESYLLPIAKFEYNTTEESTKAAINTSNEGMVRSPTIAPSPLSGVVNKYQSPTSDKNPNISSDSRNSARQNLPMMALTHDPTPAITHIPLVTEDKSDSEIDTNIESSFRDKPDKVSPKLIGSKERAIDEDSLKKIGFFQNAKRLSDAEKFNLLLDSFQHGLYDDLITPTGGENVPMPQHSGAKPTVLSANPGTQIELCKCPPDMVLLLKKALSQTTCPCPAATVAQASPNTANICPCSPFRQTHEIICRAPDIADSDKCRCDTKAKVGTEDDVEVKIEKKISETESSFVDFEVENVNPEEIGTCFRRGFRPDSLALVGDRCYNATGIIDHVKQKSIHGMFAADINFSERETPLEFLVSLGFSVDEASTALKDEGVKNRLTAAITEARVWANRMSSTQGTLLYLLAYKAKSKVMRYFLQLVEAIINRRISDAVKLDGFLQLLEKLEAGYLPMLLIFGTNKFDTDDNEGRILAKQLQRLFANMFMIAEREAKIAKIVFTSNGTKLLQYLITMYKPGLHPHLELMARYVGQGLLVSEVQLEAAMIYLSRVHAENINLQDFEHYCGIEPLYVK